MSWNQAELNHSLNQMNTSHSYDNCDPKKPIEIFFFVDPLCSECWSLTTFIKKLTMEYGRFFTIQPILSCYLSTLNKPLKQNHSTKKDNRRSDSNFHTLSMGEICPSIALQAIKAAELQGRKAGRTFFEKLQQSFFFKGQNIANKDVLMTCAKEAKLDTEIFEEDLYSSSANKSIQCDLKLAREMEIDYFPTVVFFNQTAEDQGIKVSGFYPYNIYELILKKVLQTNPIPSEKLPLEIFLAQNHLTEIREISLIYDWTLEKTEKELKKLQIQQKAEPICTKDKIIWKYVN